GARRRPQYRDRSGRSCGTRGPRTGGTPCAAFPLAPLLAARAADRAAPTLHGSIRNAQAPRTTARPRNDDPRWAAPARTKVNELLAAPEVYPLWDAGELCYSRDRVASCPPLTDSAK